MLPGVACGRLRCICLTPVTLRAHGRVMQNARFALALAFALSAQTAQASAPQPYVIAAPDGGAVLRVVTDAEACPAASVDGARQPMTLRSPPRQFPPRPSASGAAAARPSAFPLRVCEVALPRGVKRASVNGQGVPVLPAVVRRIVVIGDTGCRLKQADNAWQACDDPRAWPFAAVARAAAATKPDLVLHVGDYHYRENACPEGQAGCAGSPWGYGWDAWDVDFLAPAAPLLAAAPWVVARGNHEECARAGQGWWLLLDPHALTPAADCADPAQDADGNHTAPYPVELGDGARLIVADFAALGEKALHGDALERYLADAARIGVLARAGDTNFLTAHYPLAAVVDKKGKLEIGSAATGDAFGTADRGPDLPGVTAMVAGHVHMLQYAVVRGRPVQIVNGFSGTQEDAPKAPASLAEARAAGADGALADVFSRFGVFGFGLLDRLADGRWRYSALDQNGKTLFSKVIARVP